MILPQGISIPDRWETFIVDSFLKPCVFFKRFNFPDKSGLSNGRNYIYKRLRNVGDLLFNSFLGIVT